MQTALITGASSGIGAVFAQALAARGQNLILVARSQAKLRQLAAALQEQFGVQVEIVVQDLTQPEASAQVFEKVQQQGRVVDLLINNAGVGDYGPFAERSRKRQSNIVKLNVLALVEMTHLFLPGMQQRGAGGIISVSSVSAFQPIPYLATYAASKAFILQFSQALWAENRAKGVNVLAVCPGPTKTDFFTQAEMDSHTALMDHQRYELPEQIVSKALAGLAAGKSLVVTGGWRNQIIPSANRLAPRELLTRLLEKQFKPPTPPPNT